MEYTQNQGLTMQAIKTLVMLQTYRSGSVKCGQKVCCNVSAGEKIPLLKAKGLAVPVFGLMVKKGYCFLDV